jgi:hypothetical protein
MTIWEILISLVISVISIFLALLYENLGSPRLFFSIKPKKPIKIGNQDTYFLNLYVINKPHKYWPLVTRETAYSCHGDITFKDRASKKTFGPMPIRWSGNPEPIKFDVVDNHIVSLIEPSLLKSSRYIDIPRDEKEEIDVAVRFLQDHQAYGWNSESYLHQSKNPELELSPGTYEIEVKITCSGSSKKEKFLLINQPDIQDFRLEPFTPQPKKTG